MYDDEVEQKGGTMAQLADGKAAQIALEYEMLLHQRAKSVTQHPDWHDVSTGDKQLLWNIFAYIVFQNASGFDRRVRSHVESFPIAVLTMGRVRHDLPCTRRQEVAKRMLANASCLDLNTLKILRTFTNDIETSARTGRTGFGFFVFIRALRRLWKSDVRENERLNKQLKLYGQRAPNSSLDLIAARICLKYRLGARGFTETEFPNMRKPSKRVVRNWSNLRPMAASVFDTCMDHWVDGASEVLSQTNRFSEVEVPPWVPSKEDVHKWDSKLMGNLTGSTTLPSKSDVAGLKRNQIVAAAVNRNAYRFLNQKQVEVQSVQQASL